jgi:nicotinate-nucleotide adenylyltransferase
MLALAIAGHAAFRIDELEKERNGPSYTSDTLTELHNRHPANEFFLLIGADTLADLPSWHEPQQVVQLASLLVTRRPNHEVMPVEELRARLQLPVAMPVGMEMVEMPLIDIASRDLRRRAAAGRSLRYFLPRAVEIYILDKKLYRA